MAASHRRVMKQIGADGVNGERRMVLPLAFRWRQKKRATLWRLNGERPADEGLGWNVLYWGQYHFQFRPTVDRYRGLSRATGQHSGPLEPHKQTTFSSRSSTARLGELENCGYLMGSRRAMAKQRVAWRR